MPDDPAVARIPEVIDKPEVAAIPDDIPDVIWAPVIAVDGLAGVAVPFSIPPPPSNVPLDPDVPAGVVPNVEHVAALAPVG